MLNERKIRLMTKTAIYEKGKGREDMKVSSYGGSDYVRYNTLKTLICAAVAGLLIIFMGILYKMDDILANIMRLDYLRIGRDLLVVFLVFLGVYAVAGLIFYQQKYYRASKRLKKYQLSLKKIASIAKHDAARHY